MGNPMVIQFILVASVAVIAMISIDVIRSRSPREQEEILAKVELQGTGIHNKIKEWAFGYIENTNYIDKDHTPQTLSRQPLEVYSKIGTLSRRGILKKGKNLLAKTPNQVFISIDINHIDRINNQYGHEEGDRILIGMVKLLNEFAEDKKGSVGRWHNDVFIIIYESENYREQLKDIEQLVWNIGKLEKLKFDVSASAGVYCSGENETVEYCINCANVARKDAKRTKKELKQFDPHSSDDINKGKLEINRSIMMRELYLNYQPVVNIKTETIVGAEALIRWDHPERGIVPPNKFIPVAENNGSIDLLGNFVVQEVCAVQKMIKDEKFNSMPISINVSTKELSSDYVKNLVNVLSSYNINPKDINIEITESESIELSEVRKIISELKQEGFKVWIDDFGTGYASLSYLKAISITGIKIDKSFLDNIDKEEKDLKMLQGIISLITGLGLDIVCEGVERKSQLDIIKGMGVEKVQGFYFFKPMSWGQYTEKLSQQQSNLEYLEGNTLMELIETSIKS